LVLLPIYYGVGYRHQTSSFWPHIGAAMLVAGFLAIFCVAMNERHPANKILRRASNLMIAAVLGQVVFGIAAFVVRQLEIQNGFFLAVARTAHITGAALVLAASAEFAIQYRRSVV
jgi:heme A synthase